ncbi:hypothetical protein [Anaeromyxobacter terrae]|uniref:hypothetical protein n=1 Tax=Anaeromyxobacter terrae TaxID=2925406 RepID=UPI001F57918D|nr:hypothetical protein [Anaeromyxobacter sp. SG22]
MPTLPLHPAIVHLPLGLALAIPLVALGLVLAQLRGRVPRLALGVLLGLQVLLVASGVVAMQLGERDAHQVERVVAERVIEAHEERAEVFVWAAGAVLALSAALLFVPARLALGLSAAVAAGTLGVAALGVRTGSAGGEIVYTHGGASAFGSPPSAPGGVPAPASARAARDDD